ncbi:MAG TPA: DUF3592 domain-containing protein [Burkholderiales bacterium]|nr:DUF3592 domain-containing protein [Burkholderiales bacterium]
MHAPTLIVGAAFLAIGAGGGVAGAYLLNAGEAARLLREGRGAHAEVVHKSIRADRTTGGSLRPAYRVDYRFVPSRTEAVSGTREIDAALWMRAGRGDRVEVTYLPSEPSVHRIETEPNNRAAAIVLTVVGAAFVLLGGWLSRQAFAGGRRTPDKPRRSAIADRLSAAFARSAAFTFGVAGVLFFLPFLVAGIAWSWAQRAEDRVFSAQALPVEATLLDKAVVRKQTSVGNRPSGTYTYYRVTYRYISGDGREIVGTSNVAGDAWDRLKERGPIGVRYVPDRPWLHRLGSEGGEWTGPIALLALGGIGMLASAFAGIRGWPRWRRNATRRTRASAARTANPPMVQPAAARTPEPSRWALFFGGVFFVAGGAALIDGTLDVLHERRYAAEGREAQARIVDKRVQEAQRSGNTRTRYLVLYRFTTPDGRSVDGEAAVGMEAWEGAKRGNTIDVRYLAGEPQTNRAATEGAITGSVLVMAMGVLFALVGAAIAYLGWWKPENPGQSHI